MHVDFKRRLALQGYLAYLKRLKRYISDSHNVNNENLIFVPQAAKNQVQKLLEHGRKV